ncbi:MAG: Xaa-Pro peptidase family protein [Acidobacteriia bacterium]|nr:Xaa-Pro peptidase family protein [Terriglobia bacterium]
MELVPKSEVADRLVRLQRRMLDVSLDAVFVFQNVDLFYFAGTLQSGLLCAPASGEPLYLVQKSISRARIESPWERLLPFPGFKKLPEWLASEGIGGLRRIGIEADVLPTNYYLRLRELFPHSEFIDASETIRRIRMIKSGYELDQMRHAAQMLRTAFDRLPQWMQPGVTELEVMAQLEGFLRSLGHQGIVRMRGFNNQIGYGTVSSGASAAYPTPFPGPVGSVGLYPAAPGGGSDHRLAAGETLVVDIVGGYGGYLADKTRTFALGKPPQEMADAHRFVLDLNREIESWLKPGILCSELYRRTLERARESPYAPGFMGLGDGQVRFIGHGVGLELDELPVLAGGFDIPLEPGMTIAIEPKIFFPERGGVGIENTYLLTESGFENLTAYPEEIILI